MRILFVVRPTSVHAARWVNQIADQGWDIHLFPAHEGPTHSEFRNLTAYGLTSSRAQRRNPTIRSRVLWPLPLGADRLKILAARFLPADWSSRAAWLARVIRRVKPDMIHALEFQQAGYLTLQARALYEGQFPPLVASNWGSDIYLYGPLNEHKAKITALLSGLDYYGCECRRDVELARAYGFKGEALPVLPVAGGFRIEEMRRHRQSGPTSARRVIALKGYQHWAGRSLVGLRAIEQCADEIKAGNYRVAVYLADMDVQIAAERMALTTGIPVEIVPPGSHDDMLRLHGRARVSVGLSISDGLSTSALEAMVMGSFPVQSDTSCLTEIVRDGETALMVPPEDPSAVAAAIRRAITDDALVDRAAEINARMAAEHLDYSVIQTQVVQMYARIAAQIRAKKEAKNS
ncbi:MAG: glycosyltransferase [Acidobacteriota bacterium]|nr:glycosyltransferase [Acidobacteriota bacterium]